jgi:hypothetical protein
MASNKEIICDSSSLISLTDSCLDTVIEYLATKYKVKFIIPPSVEFETVDRPIKSDLKQYAFSAIKIRRMIDEGIVVKVETSAPEKTDFILRMANNMLFTKGKPLNLMHRGEAEMVALANELGASDLLIDERTTRMIIEAPFRMKEHMEREFGVSIMINNENMRKISDFTRGMRSIRSSELLILGYENGYLDKFGEITNAALEAALYKIKFSGCAIRFDEIAEYMKTQR